MGAVIWSPSALDDVDFIAEFIARDSVFQSSLFVIRVIEATNRLEIFPFSGRKITEIDKDNCLEIIFGAYRIMYEIKDNEIWITGVVHCARNWEPE